jgi:hypothetical protein
MRMQKVWIAVIALAVVLGGCSSPETKAGSGPAKPEAKETKPAPKPALRVTGREAFQKLYLAARNWSPDSRPLKVESRPRSDDPRDGMASTWVGTFASQQRGLFRSFMWSGAEGEASISPGSQDTYSVGNASTQPFDPAYLKTDTTEALETADKHAPAEAKKDKKGPVAFQLYNDTAKQRLLWRVIYGQSEHSAKAVVDISARDGGFVKIEK